SRRSTSIHAGTHVLGGGAYQSAADRRLRDRGARGRDRRTGRDLFAVRAGLRQLDRRRRLLRAGVQQAQAAGRPDARAACSRAPAERGQALSGVDLEVERGDFFALLGPNGAGKTTLIGIITSLVNKTGGEARVFGYDIDREPEAAKACIGIVPQELNFNMFESPYTIVVNQAGFYGIPRAVARERAEKYLKQLQLWDKRRGISRALSGGMKRRLMIARALMHEPRLLILDEPTAGVDIEIRRSMWEFLREINARGTTIILTTPYLEEAETLCRNIAIISDGRIVARDRMS